MELNILLIKNKNKLLNIAVIVTSLLIANHIYKQGNKTMGLLKSSSQDQIKKNSVLEDIGNLERRIGAYKELLAERDSNLAINAISSIAKEAGVQIVSVRPEPQQRYPDYIKVPFNVVINASDYQALGNFTGKLESHQIVYTVDYIDIRPAPKEGLVVNLKVSSVAFTD